jgi:transmembrane sensor
MTDKEAKQLLERYHKGECTPEEKARVEEWYDMLEASAELEMSQGEKQQINDELKHAIDAQIDNSKVRRLSFKTIVAAASIVILLGFGWLAFKYQGQAQHKLNPLAYNDTLIPAGKKVKLLLSDGSTIILSGGSRLQYPAKFKKSIREVNLLEGEAYFDIYHDAHKPFIVNAAGAQVNVLGTAFNIRAYKFLKNIQVTVTRGKVSVRGLAGIKYEKPTQVVLLPNEQVTIGKVNGEILKRHINSSDFTGWIQGKYRFDNETLANVAGMLESYYKVKVHFANDDLKNIRFSSEFETTDKLDDLIFAICKANNLSSKVNGQDIILSPQ